MSPLYIVLGFWVGVVIGSVGYELWLSRKTQHRDRITTNKFSRSRKALGKDHRSS